MRELIRGIAYKNTLTMFCSNNGSLSIGGTRWVWFISLGRKLEFLDDSFLQFCLIFGLIGIIGFFWEVERMGEEVWEVARFNAFLWALATKSFCNYEFSLVLLD